MKKKRKRSPAARRIVGAFHAAATVGATLVVDAARFVVDVAEEGVKAFDELGDHVEKKIEEIDE